MLLFKIWREMYLAGVQAAVSATSDETTFMRYNNDGSLRGFESALGAGC